MKNILKLMGAAGIAAVGLFGATAVQAQATTQVTPRVYTLVSNQVLTNLEVLGSTNVAALGVFASTNTFMPFSGSHSIALWATVSSTNAVGNTNVSIGLTWAYDTAGGNSNALTGRYGTNFLTTPWVWSFPLNGTNNVTAATNLPPSVWEPATSLAVAYVSNLCTKNINFQLQASVVP